MGSESKQVVLFGRRTAGNYGDDVAPTAAMLVSSISHTPMAGSTVARNNYKGFKGNSGSLASTNWQELSFEIELASSGTPGVAPAYADLLRCCGFAEVLTAVTSAVYNPIDSGEDDGTAYYYYDNVLHKMRGVRGSVELALDLGGLWKLKFKLLGLYDDAATGTPAGIDFSAFTKPLVANSQTITSFSFFGVSTLKMTNLSLNPGISVNHFDATNQEEIELSERTGTLSTTLREPDLATKNFFAETRTGTEGAMAIQLGNVAGAIVKVDVPNIQLTGTSRGADKGKSNLTITGDIVPLTAGSDFTVSLM